MKKNYTLTYKYKKYTFTSREAAEEFIKVQKEDFEAKNKQNKNQLSLEWSYLAGHLQSINRPDDKTTIKTQLATLKIQQKHIADAIKKTEEKLANMPDTKSRITQLLRKVRNKTLTKKELLEVSNITGYHQTYYKRAKPRFNAPKITEVLIYESTGETLV